VKTTGIVATVALAVGAVTLFGALVAVSPKYPTHLPYGRFSGCYVKSHDNSATSSAPHAEPAHTKDASPIGTKAGAPAT